MTVLIIEEGFNDCSNIGYVLQQNYKVLTASNVEEGLKLIQTQPFEMVVWGPNLIKEREAVILKALSSLEAVAS